MSEVTNISAVDLSLPLSDKKFFSNLYAKVAPISSDQYDSLLSYFEQITNDKMSANALTSAIMYTGAQQNISPIQILDQFRNLSAGELSRKLALFLNYYRVGTSVLGVTTVVQTNQYVLRSVLY